VVVLLVAYPDNDSALAKVPHMYVCVSTNGSVELLKCQSQKPYHLKPNSLPRKRFMVEVNVHQSPFKVRTIIDLDKVFVCAAPTQYHVIGKLSDVLFKKLLAAVDYKTAEIIKL